MGLNQFKVQRQTATKRGRNVALFPDWWYNSSYVKRLNIEVDKITLRADS